MLLLLCAIILTLKQQKVYQELALYSYHVFAK